MQSGKAAPHGAQFANQGLGCRTFLWKESEEHNVFLFLRDGVSYGEYRDEHFSEKRRFLTVTEFYLVDELRPADALSKADLLRFVRRHEKLQWQKGVWVGSEVEWSFITMDRTGTIVRESEKKVQSITRGVVSVIFTDEYTPNEKEFMVDIERATLTPYEKAFGTLSQTIETFGITNRRCSIWTKWPEDDPNMIIVLKEKVEKSPLDASPERYRYIDIARMPVSVHPPSNKPFIFSPINEARK